MGIVAILMFILAAPAHADLVQRVSEDLKPVSGYIVAQKAGEFIIDLDAVDGVAPGDIFGIIRPGEPLTHPKTGKVLGRLDETTGLLKVTLVKEGYSHARPIDTAEGARGDIVRRYEGIPAVFWDYTGKGVDLYIHLRDSLPGLNWRSYESTQTVRPDPPAPLKEPPSLYFILTADGLEIRDPEFQTLHKYGSGQSSLKTPTEPKPIVSKPAQEAVPPPKSEPKKAPAETITFKPEYEDFQRIDNLPGVTRMADFIRYDGRLLMATAESNTVHIFSVSDRLSPVAKLETDSRTGVFAVKWWRPEGADQLHLAVTAWANDSLQSAIYTLAQTSLMPLQTYIPYFLGSLDQNQDGSPETLIAQSFDRDTFWGRRFQEIRRTSKGVETVPSSLSLPAEFPVLAGTLADLTGDGKPERIYVLGKTLYIRSETEELFRMPGAGGSLAAISYALNPDQQAVQTKVGAIEIAPLAMDVDGDGRPEVVAAAAAQSPFAIPGIYSGFSYSQLAVIKYQDGRFVQGTLGDQINSPIQGLALDNGKILFVASRPETIAGKSGGSDLNAYLLAR